MKKTALVVPALALLAGCSGGGGGGNNVEPCCAAQGQTDAPPSGFAFAGGGSTIEGRFAQAVVFDATSCFSLNDSLLLLPEYDAVSKAVEVDSTGGYTLELDEDAVGAEVAIRVFDELSDGRKIDRAVSYLARPPIENPDGAPISVAPIRFQGQFLSEGTIEAGAYCFMRNAAAGSGDDLQNLTLSDIRAVVTSGFAANFVPGGGNQEGVLRTLRNYRHAINGLVDPTKNGGFDVTATLRDLRLAVDEEVDACAAGLTGLTNDAACATGPDYYRYWLLTTNDFNGFEAIQAGFRNHLLATAQDMSDALSGVDARNHFDMELLRSNYRLRLELMAETLRNAVTCYAEPVAGTCNDSTGPTMDVDPNGNGSINEILQRLRDQVDTAFTPTEIRGAFDAAGLDIASNFGLQTAIAGDSLYFDTINYAYALQNTIQDDFTHEQIAAAMFGSNGAFAQTLTEVQTQQSGIPVTEQGLLTVIMFATNVSVPDLVVDETPQGAGFTGQ